MALKLLVNTQSKETFTEGFFSALKHLRQVKGLPELVVEVHETPDVDVERLRESARRLAEIDAWFAYDAFGAGQPRLSELGDVPAHFVKFDMVDPRYPSSERTQSTSGAQLGTPGEGPASVPLAEGVELEAEAVVCREMGFRLVQGFLIGRPVPISVL